MNGSRVLGTGRVPRSCALPGAGALTAGGGGAPRPLQTTPAHGAGVAELLRHSAAWEWCAGSRFDLYVGDGPASPLRIAGGGVGGAIDRSVL